MLGALKPSRTHLRRYCASYDDDSISIMSPYETTMSTVGISYSRIIISSYTSIKVSIIIIHHKWSQTLYLNFNFISQLQFYISTSFYNSTSLPSESSSTAVTASAKHVSQDMRVSMFLTKLSDASESSLLKKIVS